MGFTVRSPIFYIAIGILMKSRDSSGRVIFLWFDVGGVECEQ